MTRERCQAQGFDIVTGLRLRCDRPPHPDTEDHRQEGDGKIPGLTWRVYRKGDGR